MADPIPPFEGFPAETVRFLEALGANNSKSWFDTHRGDYQRLYLQPAMAFVSTIEAPLRSLVPEIRVEPRVNGSIFRINRDIRFAKDKTPYKDHIDLWFWQGDRKQAVSGFFMRVTATRLILGAGNHGLDKAALATFRACLGEADTAKELSAIVTTLESAGYRIGGEHYARLPRGLSATHPAQERFLRHNGLWAALDQPHPDNLTSAALVDHCVGHWQTMAPLHRWLIQQLA